MEWKWKFCCVLALLSRARSAVMTDKRQFAQCSTTSWIRIFSVGLNKISPLSVISLQTAAISTQSVTAVWTARMTRLSVPPSTLTSPKWTPAMMDLAQVGGHSAVTTAPHISAWLDLIYLIYRPKCGQISYLLTIMLDFSALNMTVVREIDFKWLIHAHLASITWRPRKEMQYQELEM